MADISSCDQYKRLVSETASRWKSLDPPAKQLHSVSFKHALSVNKQMTGGLFLLLGASQELQQNTDDEKIKQRVDMRLNRRQRV